MSGTKMDPLLAAVKKGSIQNLQTLLDATRRRRIRNRDRLGAALLKAIRIGDREKVSLILNYDPPLDYGANSVYQTTPMHAAAADCEILALLLDAGADIEIKNRLGDTPLHLAVEKNNLEAVELLLKKGANVHALCGSGSSALHLACQSKHNSNPEVIRALVRHGADLEARIVGDFCSQWTPLDTASWHDNAAAIKVLIALGANIAATRPNDYETALHTAVSQGSLKSVQALLEAGANIHIRNDKGQTLVHYIGTYGVFEPDTDSILPLILSAGLSVNEKDNRGRSPLQHTIADMSDIFTVPECQDIIEILLNNGADTKTCDNNGNGVLHELVRSLVLANDRLDDEEMEDGSSFHSNCCFAVQLIELLVKHGADATWKNFDGYTPLQYFRKILNNEALFLQKHHEIAPVMVALIKAGDLQSWHIVPRNPPCPGLGEALPAVWKKDRKELMYLMKRLSVSDKEYIKKVLPVLRSRGLPEELQIQIIGHALSITRYYIH